MNARIPRVAVALPLNAKIPRDMRRGILRYAKEHGPWMIHLLEGREFSQKISDLECTGLDGFLGYVMNDDDVRSIERLKVPAVLRWLDSGHLPAEVDRLMRRSATILTDSTAIGRMAAEYYLSGRYENFAYVGEPEDIEWSRTRERAFKEELARAGRTCHVFRGPPTRSFAVELPILGEWLKKLPKPVGIFAVHDERARQIADACAMMNLSVPFEVGILGSDNDDALCETSYPTLSSIAVDAERAAYIAAKMLDRFMKGGPACCRRIVYGPVRVVKRQSTALSGRRFDPLVEDALRMIELNATNGVSIDGVCSLLKMSRRQLERRFIAAGRGSLLSEINRIKLERARILLGNDALKLRKIASDLGFSSVSHFCKIYRARYGETPRATRKI